MKKAKQVRVVKFAFTQDKWMLYLMLLPAVIIIIIYNYVPLGGLVMAFQNYSPALGFLRSPWVGLDNFAFLVTMKEFSRALRNTVLIAVSKIILGIIVPVVFALLLNEVRKKNIQRIIQTLIYLPHFISWVLLASILRDMFSPSTGIINKAIELFGMTPVHFLGDNKAFPLVIIFRHCRGCYYLCDIDYCGIVVHFSNHSYIGPLV
jgi:putative aldouronate transport system permease protein